MIIIKTNSRSKWHSIIEALFFTCGIAILIFGIIRTGNSMEEEVSISRLRLIEIIGFYAFLGSLLSNGIITLT